MVVNRRAALVSLLAVSATMLVAAESASAAPLGSLSFQECFDGVAGGMPCGASNEVNGLANGVRPVAVSPDGKDVYAASRFNGGLVHFDRAPDGSLTFIECFDDDTAPVVVCGAGHQLDALNGATGITISPDGSDVYVTTEFDDAVLHFARANSGNLTYTGCLDSPGAPVLCGGVANEVLGLDGALYSDLSPDGKQLYITGFTLTNIDGFLVALNLTPSGDLSAVGSTCFNSNFTGLAPCGAGNEVDGLMNAAGVSVAPDGKNVYVTGHFDNTVVTFDRAPGGALSNPRCISDVADPSCTLPDVSGLGEPTFVEVSGDSANVYVTGLLDDAVVTFDRAPDGSLVNARCVGDIGGTSGCATVAQGLDGARSISFSADGATAYVPAEVDDAINFFDRAPDGSLIWRSCVDNVGGVAACGSEAPGLDEAFFSAVAPDGISVYTGASTTSSVDVFRREVGPRCLGSSSFGEPGQTQTVPLECSDPNGDALSFEIVDAPDSGTLGAVDARVPNGPLHACSRVQWPRQL